uniref:Putative secreted protein n=1 Tax=Rhipicephalus microplus TaxID=6941 RepID=A0A6M2DAY9_RHIMP
MFCFFFFFFSFIMTNGRNIHGAWTELLSVAYIPSFHLNFPHSLVFFQYDATNQTNLNAVHVSSSPDIVSCYDDNLSTC